MNNNIERHALAPDLTISRVLTGLWQIADRERNEPSLDLAEAAAAMAPYVDAGFTTFDMADHYGSAEEIAGIFQKGRSENRPQLLTKWVPKPGPVSREDVKAAVSTSMKRLQTDRIDLLQFHAWNYADPRWLDCLYFLQELKSEGLIRHLGLTNFDTAHLQIVLHSGFEVVSNQVCFSLIDQRPTLDMIPLCEKHGVKILAYGTIAGGFLDETWLDREEPAIDELPTWSLMKYKRFIDAAGGWEVFQRVLSTADQVARKLGVSVANVASRYILDQPSVAGIILGARLGNRNHREKNLRLFGFSLDEESRHELKRALSHLTMIPGDCGDEYRKPPFLTAAGDLSDHFSGMPSPFEKTVGTDGKTRVTTGTIWEDICGFSRAIQSGNHIWISGTTATHGQKPIGGSDPAAQFHFIVDKIEASLQSLGARLSDVIRTRIYLRNVDDWEAVSRAHGKRFAGILPANTLVQAQLIGEEYLVEVEAEAVKND